MHKPQKCRAGRSKMFSVTKQSAPGRRLIKLVCYSVLSVLLPPGTDAFAETADSGAITCADPVTLNRNADYGSQMISPADPTHYILTVLSPEAGGSTSGGGIKPVGSFCTVTATPASGYSFLNWTEGGTVVSASASYTFLVMADRTLTANFTTALVIPLQKRVAINNIEGPQGSVYREYNTTVRLKNPANRALAACRVVRRPVGCPKTLEKWGFSRKA